MSEAFDAIILAGGRGSRMGGISKADLVVGGERLLDGVLRAASSAARIVVVGDTPVPPGVLVTREDPPGTGPAAGLVAGLAAITDPSPWTLVLACDLPFLDAGTLQHLIARRDPTRIATAFRSSHDGLPEPLCAIYEPAALAGLEAFVAGGRNCPRKFLIQSGALLLDQPRAEALDNVNTPTELDDARQRMAQPAVAARELRVQYFALLREQAGRRDETVTTGAPTPRELFAELSARHGFTLAPEHLKVAVNSEFSDWSRPLAAGDHVVFIPPVAGG